jgi:hypothetical protein
MAHELRASLGVKRRVRNIGSQTMPNRHDIQDNNKFQPPQGDSVWALLRSIIQKFSEEGAVFGLVLMTYIYGIQAGVNHWALHFFCFLVLGGYLTIRLVRLLSKRN